MSDNALRILDELYRAASEHGWRHDDLEWLLTPDAVPEILRLVPAGTTGPLQRYMGIDVAYQRHARLEIRTRPETAAWGAHLGRDMRSTFVRFRAWWAGERVQVDTELREVGTADWTIGE